MSTAAPACEQEPGVIYPVVDLNRCEGKGDCERVCPENVFEVKRIDEADYRSLGASLVDCASVHAPNTPLR